MNIRKIFPAFLTRVDAAWLKNRPVLWTTRIHYVLFFSLIAWVILSLLAYLSFGDSRSNSTQEFWLEIVSVITVLGLVFWLIYLLRFNVFKKFGSWSWKSFLTSFLCYFFSVLAISSILLAAPIIESIRAKMQFQKSEIVSDVNRMNALLIQLENKKINHNLTYSSYRKLANGEVARSAFYDAGENTLLENFSVVPSGETVQDLESGSEIATRLDTSDLHRLIITADSVRFVGDTLVYIYQYPELTFIHSYYQKSSRFLTSKQLFNQFLLPPVSGDTVILKKELVTLLNKYVPSDFRYVNYYDYFDSYVEGPLQINSRIENEYQTRAVNAGLDNNGRKRNRWEENTVMGILHTYYYVALIVSLLLLAYRSVSRNVFFLSLLAVLVLAIFSAFIYSSLNLKDVGLLQLLLFYFIVFLVWSILQQNLPARSISAGICIILSMLLLPFVPTIIAALYNEVVLHRLPDDSERWPEMHKIAELRLKIAELVGFVILVIILPLLYSRLFRNWFAKPAH